MVFLQYVCLDAIAEEFEKFHLALISNDETYKQYSDFLKKNYSYELGSILSFKRKLKSKYLDYLMNEYLQTFHLEWLTGIPYEYAIGDILCRVPNLTKLDCDYIICSDEILENVAKFCPEIIEIEACENSVTDKGVMYLCKNEDGNVSCPNLKCLTFDLDKISDECLKCLLRDLPSLESIFSNKIPKILYSLYKKDFPRLENVHEYNLVNLNLISYAHISYYTDLFKICMTVCPRLKVLACCISHKEQLNFFNNIRLEELSIRFLRTGEKNDVNNFLKKHGCSLTSLEVYNCIMSTSALTVSCPNLEFLEIENVTFVEDDSGPVLSSLVSCVFKNINDITSGIAARLLLSSSKLESLQFIFCSLSSDAKTSILKCCENYQVNTINFHGTIIEMNVVKVILSCCPSLRLIDLAACGFSHDERRELTEIAEMLPNKPNINFN